MYAVLVILVATGLTSTVGFKRIGALIVGQVENPEAMHAHGRMSTALDEQMHALLVLLERPLEETESAALDRTVGVFDKELDAAVALDGADEFGLPTVQKAWDVHRARIRAISAAGGTPSPAALAEAFTSLSTLRRATNGFVLRRKLDVSSLRRLIRQTARHYVLLAVALTALGMVVALLFHYRFSHFVRRPIEKLTAFVRRGGALGERVSVQGDAGIVELAEACNEYFETVERRTEDHWAELRAERRIATALVETIPGPVVLLNAVGDPVRANAAARDHLTSERGDEVRRELRRVFAAEEPLAKSPYIAESREVRGTGEFSGSLVRLAEPLPASAPPAASES